MLISLYAVAMLIFSALWWNRDPAEKTMAPPSARRLTLLEPARSHPRSGWRDVRAKAGVDYHWIDLKDNYFAFDGRDKSGHSTDMILFDHWGDKQAARPKWTYLNHAIKSKANVELRRSMKNGRVDARFVATKRILKGKQIFLCYGKNPELRK